MQGHRIRFAKTAACLAVLLAASPVVQANLIVNGGFERAAPGYNGPEAGYTTLQSIGLTANAIEGWKVTSGSIDWIGGYWTAKEGSRSIDLNGNAQGIIVAQTVTTSPDGWYQLSFWMAGNPDNEPRIKTMDVLINDQLEAQPWFDTRRGEQDVHTHGAMGWEKHTLLFQASSVSTTISFRSTTGGETNPYGPAIDDVSLVAVPAPAAALLAVLGLSIVGWIKRKVA